VAGRVGGGMLVHEIGPGLDVIVDENHNVTAAPADGRVLSR